MINIRASGVLMHISSLPGDTGIGTMGRSAYDFVDFLRASGQTYWQILPICPTSFGDSPYQSFSTFAGNHYFIDLHYLADDGYITEDDISSVCWGENDRDIDYALIYEQRNKIFEKVQDKFAKSKPNDFNDFCAKNEFWLNDYSLFMAIKDEHDGASFDMWENDIRTRKKGVCDMWRVKCSKRVEYYKMLQYFFFKQWTQLKKYANENGIKIIGDLPIYVAADSADVWANPRLFSLNQNLTPIEVAGCPPDAFSEDGQLWGNPVYNWKYLRRTKYDWWIKRLKASLEIYDVIRIDHFRGFESYYCIDAKSENARQGIWRKGPGMDLWKKAKRKLGDMPIIAEDLGFLTDDVRKMLDLSGFPGMKVLQFAFDKSGESDYLPHKYDKNCVVYCGTHDNDTILGFVKNADKEDIEFAKEYLFAKTNEDICKNMMICALQSVADTAILTMQDLIGLGSEGRMNVPSTVGTNWRWRAEETDFTSDISSWLYRYTKLFRRMTNKNGEGDKHE